MNSAAWEKLRHLRHQGHNAFDKLWKERFINRERAYALLASELGIPLDDCHFSQFDEEQCLKAIKFSRSFEVGIRQTVSRGPRRRQRLDRRARLNELRESELG